MAVVGPAVVAVVRYKCFGGGLYDTTALPENMTEHDRCARASSEPASVV